MPLKKLSSKINRFSIFIVTFEANVFMPAKKKQISDHLKKYKSITSLQAIDLYAVTRLSDIIYRLRYKMQWKIDSIMCKYIDKKGNAGTYSNYVLRSEQPSIEKQKPKTKYLKPKRNVFK